jgi:NMD protein affecting ribosome stability and mRNA decay
MDLDHAEKAYKCLYPHQQISMIVDRGAFKNNHTVNVGGETIELADYETDHYTIRMGYSPSSCTLVVVNMVPYVSTAVTVEIKPGRIAICDDRGFEIIEWSERDWEEDPEVVYAIAKAILVGMDEGGTALRNMIGR